MPRIHETLSGHEIRYDDPGPELETFLRKVSELAADAKVGEAELVALVYGAENPILDRGIFPERGAVTRETLDRPEYAVMQDLLFRKEVQARKLDVEKIAARYTLTTAEVASLLGVHVSAVQQAIKARRVSSWVKDGRHYLDPMGLTPLEHGKRRGPKAAASAAPYPVVHDGGTFRPLGGVAVPGSHDVDRTLLYRVGHVGNAVLRIRLPEGEPPSKEKPAEGQVAQWRRVGVLHGRAGKLRFFELEPDELLPGERIGPTPELKLGGLYVRGGFKVARKVNSAKAAREAWDEFQAA